MSKHNWHEAKIGNNVDQGLVIDQTTGANIAVTYERKHAKLIAAAPELLNALMEIILPFEILCDCGDEDDEDMQKIYDKAQAAIAKATN